MGKLTISIKDLKSLIKGGYLRKPIKRTKKGNVYSRKQIIKAMAERNRKGGMTEAEMIASANLQNASMRTSTAATEAQRLANLKAEIELKRMQEQEKRVQGNDLVSDNSNAVGLYLGDGNIPMNRLPGNNAGLDRQQFIQNNYHADFKRSEEIDNRLIALEQQKRKNRNQYITPQKQGYDKKRAYEPDDEDDENDDEDDDYDDTLSRMRNNASSYYNPSIANTPIIHTPIKHYYYDDEDDDEDEDDYVDNGTELNDKLNQDYIALTGGDPKFEDIYAGVPTTPLTPFYNPLKPNPLSIVKSPEFNIDDNNDDIPDAVSAVAPTYTNYGSDLKSGLSSSNDDNNLLLREYFEDREKEKAHYSQPREPNSDLTPAKLKEHNEKVGLSSQKLEEHNEKTGVTPQKEKPKEKPVLTKAEKKEAKKEKAIAQSNFMIAKHAQNIIDNPDVRTMKQMKAQLNVYNEHLNKHHETYYKLNQKELKTLYDKLPIGFK